MAVGTPKWPETENAALDAACLDLEGQGGPGCGDLVEPVRPMHDETAREAELCQRASH